jgi:hypothetical protein
MFRGIIEEINLYISIIIDRNNISTSENVYLAHNLIEIFFINFFFIERKIFYVKQF